MQRARLNKLRANAKCLDIGIRDDAANGGTETMARTWEDTEDEDILGSRIGTMTRRSRTGPSRRGEIVKGLLPRAFSVYACGIQEVVNGTWREIRVIVAVASARAKDLVPMDGGEHRPTGEETRIIIVTQKTQNKNTLTGLIKRISVNAHTDILKMSSEIPEHSKTVWYLSYLQCYL